MSPTVQYILNICAFIGGISAVIAIFLNRKELPQCGQKFIGVEIRMAKIEQLLDKLDAYIKLLSGDLEKKEDGLRREIEEGKKRTGEHAIAINEQNVKLDFIRQSIESMEKRFQESQKKGFDELRAFFDLKLSSLEQKLPKRKGD